MGLLYVLIGMLKIMLILDSNSAIYVFYKNYYSYVRNNSISFKIHVILTLQSPSKHSLLLPALPKITRFL
jgi:hypothetical protein